MIDSWPDLYYLAFPNDRRPTKIIVYFAFTIETLQTAFALRDFHMLYSTSKGSLMMESPNFDIRRFGFMLFTIPISGVCGTQSNGSHLCAIAPDFVSISAYSGNHRPVILCTTYLRDFQSQVGHDDCSFGESVLENCSVVINGIINSNTFSCPSFSSSVALCQPYLLSALVKTRGTLLWDMELWL